MDAEQLEAYRKRMQEKYLSQRSPETVSPLPEDEFLAKQLQDKEFASVTTYASDEELARKLQQEANSEEEVRPPLQIQKEERLVDFGEEEDKPLLAARPGTTRESCRSRVRRMCRQEPGTVLLAGFAASALVGALVLLAILYFHYTVHKNAHLSF